MTNEEKVLEFKAQLDKAFKAYFVCDICINAFFVAIGVVALIVALNSDNNRALMLVVLGLFVLIFGASFVMIKLFFGSISGLNKIMSFRSRASFATKTFASSEKDYKSGKIDDAEYSIAKTIYDDEIKNLVSEIDDIKVKKQ